MPYVLRPPIRRVRLGLALAVLVLSAVAFPAFASAACPVKPTSQVFEPYGDNGYYSLVPGGDFDLGAPGWTLDRADLESSESFIPPPLISDLAAPEPLSLKITRKGRAVSPEVCVSVRHPTFRFFAFSSGGRADDLGVGLRWTDSQGHEHGNRVGSLDADSFEAGWKLSPELPLARALPLKGEETAQVKLVFDLGSKYKRDEYDGSDARERRHKARSQRFHRGHAYGHAADRWSKSGYWLIDQVYVDPYRR